MRSSEIAVMRRTRAFVFVLTLFAFALAFAKPARATTNFPQAIQNDLSLPTAPACALCHTTGDQGGKGTVNTPFGSSMRALGLVEFDETSLRSALAKMQAQQVDSDGDCVDDIDELKKGTDPNVPDSGQTCDAGVHLPTSSATIPRYGCGAHVAPTSDGPSPIALLALGTAALGAAMRLRRKRAR